MAEEERNVTISKFDERWITFLMREYVKSHEADIDRLVALADYPEDLRVDMQAQLQWLVGYAVQRNRETCENLGIDLRHLTTKWKELER